MKTLLWIEDQTTKDEILSGLKDIIYINVEFFISPFSETKFIKARREMRRRNCDKIIKFSNEEFTIFYKKNSSWTNIDRNEAIFNYAKSNKISIDSEKGEMNSFFKGKYESDIKYKEGKFLVNTDSLRKVLSFYVDDDWMNNISDNGSTIIKSRSLKSDKKKFDDFTSRLIKSQTKGLVYDKIETSKNKIKLTNTYGKIFIEFDEKDETVLIESISNSDETSKQHYFINGTIENIVNNINNIKAPAPTLSKINKKQLIWSVIGFSMFIILAWFTFSYVFDPANTTEAFKILGQKNTYQNPWVYLMFLNFVIAPFQTIIITILVTKMSSADYKVNWKFFGNLFIAGQIRITTNFLTGNPYIGTFVWGLYMTTTSELRAVTLVGATASYSILMGIMMIPVGIGFMVSGTIYDHNILTVLGQGDRFIAYATLSWMGWIWNILHNISLSILILLPFLHRVWSRYLIIRYGNSSDTERLKNKLTSYEMTLINLKSSVRGLFKNRPLMVRMMLVVAVSIIMETLEYTYTFMMIEDSFIKSGEVITEHGNYWNILSISGSRLMANYVHHVPIINILPGQGMGITDSVLDNLSVAIMAHKHGVTEISDGFRDMGQQATFVLRFFNFYMAKVLAMSVTLICVVNLTIRKWRKNK